VGAFPDNLLRRHGVRPERQFGLLDPQTEPVLFPLRQRNRIPTRVRSLRIVRRQRREVALFLRVQIGNGGERHRFRAGVGQPFLQTLEVLSPVQIGIDQDVFGMSRGKLVEVRQVIGMTRTRRQNRPQRQRGRGRRKPFAAGRVVQRPPERLRSENREPEVHRQDMPHPDVDPAEPCRQQNACRERQGESGCKGLSPSTNRDRGARQREDQQAEGRFHQQHDRVVIPKPVGAQLSEQVGEVPARVVLRHLEKPKVELRRGQPDVAEIHFAEGEPVGRPDHRRQYRDGDPERGDAVPDGRAEAARGEVSGREIPEDRHDRRSGEIDQAREFRGHGQCGAESKYGRGPRSGPLEPDASREKSRAERRGERHIGGGETGVRQHRRQRTEQQQRRERDRRAEIPLRPEIHDRARQPEERQNPGAGGGERRVVRLILIEDVHAGESHEAEARPEIFLGSGGDARVRRRTVQAPPEQKRPEACEHTRQRRMLRLHRVRAAVQPLQPAGDVRRLIGGMAEYPIGRHDPRGRNRDQQDREQETMPVQEGGQPGSDRGRRDWRKLLVHRRGAALRFLGCHEEKKREYNMRVRPYDP
jgi:hypothetical protein